MLRSVKWELCWPIYRVEDSESGEFVGIWFRRPWRRKVAFGYGLLSAAPMLITDLTPILMRNLEDRAAAAVLKLGPIEPLRHEWREDGWTR